MFNRIILILTIILVFVSISLNSSPKSPPNVEAAAALPSIRACTNSELNLIMIAIDNVNSDLNDLNDAIDSTDLDDMRDRSVAMHLNWYESSPTIPYCAQGVHTRLLIDRMIEVMTLTGLTMSYGDYSLGSEYANRIDATAQDLITYGGILDSYY